MSGDVPILAYLRGDDGWSLDRAVAAIATRLGNATGAAPERWRVTGAETSAALINERVATAPMFGGGTVAESHLPKEFRRIEVVAAAAVVFQV